jgi:hypothetical protein
MGIFEGRVSLENNGGFSSIRRGLASVSTEKYSKFMIRVKGDGKTYQFRVKADQEDRHSYAFAFETTGDWQNIAVPFEQMYPTYRGTKLSIPNFPGEQLEQCAFLIANEKDESFRLEIDRIWME